jgi:hypothetical protein
MDARKRSEQKTASRNHLSSSCGLAPAAPMKTAHSKAAYHKANIQYFAQSALLECIHSVDARKRSEQKTSIAEPSFLISRARARRADENGALQAHFQHIC